MIAGTRPRGNSPRPAAPNMHKRFRAQTVRVAPLGCVADFDDIVIAAAPQQEWSHTNAGLRGLILLVERQGGFARFR